MEHVSLAELEPARLADGTIRRRLSASLETAHVAINHYEIPPGAGFPGGLHAHMDLEEIFVVLAGEATFETVAGERTVTERAAIRFAPGEFQSGRNDADEPLVALAMGAPRETDDVRIPVACHECGFDTMRLVTTGSEATFACPACGATSAPAPCPECGHRDLRVILGDGTDTLVVCHGCGALYDDPPLHG